MSIPPPRRILIAVIFALLVAVASAAPGPRGVELAGGVIVDPVRGALYAMQPETGIACVDLTSGRTRWHTTHGSVPLLLREEGLLVWRPGSLAVLNPEDGSVLQTCKPVGSTWAPPHFGEALGSRGSLSAHETREGVLVLWNHVSWYSGGAAISRDEMAKRRVAQAGAVRVDMARGAVRVVATQDPPTPKPLPFDVAMEKVDGQAGIVLYARGERKILATGKPMQLFQAHASDNRHLITIEQLGQEPGGALRYRWRVFSLPDGKRLSAFEATEPLGRFVIWKDALVSLSPGEMTASVRCVSLADGKHRWTQAMRDLRYHGPRPPAGQGHSH